MLMSDEDAFRQRVLKVLKQCEYAAVGYENCYYEGEYNKECPVCGMEEYMKHEPDCELAVLLRELKERA